jgi:murein DD-endopeptidase MepM/ murein hydrolase activator NlpD
MAFSPKQITQLNLKRWLPAAAWIVAAAMVALVGYLAVYRPILGKSPRTTSNIDFGAPLPASLPAFEEDMEVSYISRQANIDTVVPRRSRVDVETYTVDFGDSVFAIAAEFDITPETLLWANYEILNDNPDFLEPGMQLNIPPIDGVYYRWQQSDTLDSVAAHFEAIDEDIVNWIGNRLDLLNPVIEPGVWIMVPGGQREFRQWIVPAIARGSAGVSKTTYGPGACGGPYTGLYGSGAFVWPSPIHEIIGNDYWSGHLGLDIASDSSTPVYASDSGVVVFSGWANGGYGYIVMVDHGSGYQTLYGHLSQTTVYCGQSVSAGQTIAYGGSSGNSTGPHLHFEVRLDGGFVNPWFVLPAP